MKIGIFYIATSVYVNYFENFLVSIHNLFPNDEKELIVLSDGLSEYNDKKINGVNIKVIEILDYPYPIITANKVKTVAYYMKKLNLEYAMYVDADTICLEQSNELWENLKSKIKAGKFIMSYHPHYLYTPNREFGNPFIVDMKYSVGYMDKKLVNDNKCYIITSFFLGRYDEIKKYGDLIYKMLGEDLKNIRWMPVYPDEAYFNRIYVNETIENEMDNIQLDKYITINPYIFGDFPERDNGDIYKNNFPEFDTIFLNQKYNVLLKESKKSNNV